jgi:hypothetical protein
MLSHNIYNYINFVKQIIHRPNYCESTIVSEVKQRRVWLVFGWVAGEEIRYIVPFFILLSTNINLRCFKNRTNNCV